MNLDKLIPVSNVKKNKIKSVHMLGFPFDVTGIIKQTV
jgi:hypothetical protein